jgi:hypothetical protein
MYKISVAVKTLHFFIINKLAQYARVLHYIALEKLAYDKHFGLLGPFVSYEENEVL